MNTRSLIPWILAGGLAASTVFNLGLTRRLNDVETVLEGYRSKNETRAATTPAALPGRLVSKLGLTREQCEMIRGCSMT